MNHSTQGGGEGEKVMDHTVDAEKQALDAGPHSPAPSERFLPRQDWRERLQAPFALTEGCTYEAWHPFLREEYMPPPDDGEMIYAGAPIFTWRPGWTYEACGRYGEDSKEVWAGEGEQLRTIVSIHRPGRFPTRVFYIRQWRDPDGKIFGKTGLRCVVAGTFRAWLRGERWPSYTPARAAHIRWAMMPVGYGDAKLSSTLDPDDARNMNKKPSP